MHSTPASLIQRLQLPGNAENKQEAWSRFVRLYTPLLYSWARRLNVPRQETLDLIQEVLAILVRKLPEFDYDPTQSFRAWLRTVTINKYREIRRRRCPPVTADDAILNDLCGTTGDAFEEEEYRRHLVTCALRLMQAEFPLTTWRACWEHVVSDRSAADIAAELGITENAVYVAKHRVLRRLRQELSGLLD